jgi:DNA-binding CsgD family transcriptional regulator
VPEASRVAIRKVFRKLGITSRVRLAHALREQEQAAKP